MSMRTVVYGYVRLSRSDGRRLERLRREIAAYCEREGFALELVFADCGVPDSAAVRPGWTALLDHVGRAGACVVVLPAIEHLSGDLVLRAEMRCRLAAAGVRLAVMPPTPTAPDTRQRDGCG